MRSIKAALVAVVAIALSAHHAVAQEGSEECLRLESELASSGRARPGNDPRALQQQMARAQAELDRAQNQAKNMNCGRRFIFAPAPPPECGPLTDRIRQLQANLDRLDAQSSQAAQAPQDPRRRDLLIALARGNCGPQYRLVERKVVTQPERKGFFEMLFGGGGSAHEETVIEPEMDPDAMPRVSTFRTVCVRTCDGFFFPISFQTSRNAFERDEAICQATCPGSEAKLFAYPNPGGQMEQATDVNGEPYKNLQNAFRYRKEFVNGCSCKPEGQSWAEALSGVEDKTVKQGDIVVDEQRAQELSRPGAAQAQIKPQRPTRQNQQQPAPADQGQFGQQPADVPPPPGATGATGGSGYGAAPPGTLEERRTIGASGRPRVNDGRAPSDVIILDENQPRRGAIQSRPLDGPSVDRIQPQQ